LIGLHVPSADWYFRLYRLSPAGHSHVYDPSGWACIIIPVSGGGDDMTSGGDEDNAMIAVIAARYFILLS